MRNCKWLSGNGVSSSCNEHRGVHFQNSMCHMYIQNNYARNAHITHAVFCKSANILKFLLMGSLLIGAQGKLSRIWVMLSGEAHSCFISFWLCLCLFLWSSGFGTLSFSHQEKCLQRKSSAPDLLEKPAS